MKKLLAILLGVTIGLTAFATNYDSDTLGSSDQSYDGRVVAKYFSYATSTTAHTTNDTIVLTRIPENAMITGGEISVTAMGGAQTFDVGLMGADGSGYYTGTTANDVDLFLDGISCSNLVTDTFANLENGDGNALFELGARPVYLTVTCPTAWTTNETIRGVVFYIEP